MYNWTSQSSSVVHKCYVSTGGTGIIQDPAAGKSARRQCAIFSVTRPRKPEIDKHYNDENRIGANRILTGAVTAADLEPPHSNGVLTPAVGRHERPCSKSVVLVVSRSAGQQLRPSAAGRRQNNLDITTTRRRQRDDGLDVLEITDRVRRSGATVTHHRHLRAFVDRDGSDET